MRMSHDQGARPLVATTRATILAMVIFYHMQGEHFVSASIPIEALVLQNPGSDEAQVMFRQSLDELA